MTDEIPDWLCPLIKLSDFEGNVELYLENVFSIFKKDFIDKRPLFKNKNVLYNKNDENGKPNGFMHITTEEDKITRERNTCLRRCERIGWIRLVIENSNKQEVLAWEKETRNPKGKWVKRTFLFLKKQDFLVILEELKNGFLIISSIYVDNTGQKKKHLRDYKIYSQNKSLK